MKFRPILLLSACLLFSAALAGAMPAPPADTPVATPVVAAPAPAPEQAEPSCAASPLQEALSLTPNPSLKAGSQCGACSPTNCQGLNINASCYYLTRTGYAIGKCHADSVCSDTGFSARCICRNGPDV